MDKVICKTCGFENTSVSKFCKDCGYELQKIKTPEVANLPKNTKQENNAFKKILGLAFGAITIVLIFYSVNHFNFNSSIDKSMMAFASELNKSCPMMVDSETQLDNAIALPKNVFQYNYTLVNIEKSQTDTIMLKNYLEPLILNQVRSNPQMDFQREQNWTLNYLYKDMNGKYLMLIHLTPDKYKN